MTTTLALYIIWALIPTFLFLLSLWSYLEKTAGKKKQERPGDLFRQGLFVGGCVLVSIGLDVYVLPSLFAGLAQDYVPYGVFQLVLFPLVLYFGAKIIGPSKPIQIAKAPTSKKIR